MGRKEKSVNASTAPTSTISKRPNTRQIGSSANSSTENEKMDILNKIDDSSSNDTDGNSQSLDISNERVSKSTRRSNLRKQTIETQAETGDSVSTISQRPRRQVKHKFIRSANANVTVTDANSVTNNDVSVESTSLLSTLSPNSKLRLVPMIYRLPINSSNLNWQDVIGNNSTETVGMEHNETKTVENESEISNAKETKTELPKKVNNSKPAARRGRPSKQTARPTQTFEYHTMSATNFEDLIHETIIPQNTVKDIDTSDNDTTDNDTTDNNQTSAFYVDDDEDDIMIVEEKDALDIPDQIEYVAEEVVIEETIHDDTEIVCVLPMEEIPQSNEENEEIEYKETDDNNESDLENEPNDNNKTNQPQSETMNAEEEDAIYLSDSLSCFGDDSDTQDSESPELANKSDDVQGNNTSTQQIGEEDEDGPLNESADDVIIVTECTDAIEIERPETEDEHYTTAIETCIESDSQPSADSDKPEQSEHTFKSAFDNSEQYETPTDADDDSSEVEKRHVRSRRGNIARKNYSCRRNYSKRKTKTDSNAPDSDGVCTNKSVESLKTLTVEYSNASELLSNQPMNDELILQAMVQECNTTDGTDEEIHLNLARPKSVRTYVRKNPTISNAESSEDNLKAPAVSLAKDDDKTESSSEMSQTEVVKSSDYEVQASDDTKSETTVMPRKRGRPRKKGIVAQKPVVTPAATEEKESNSSSGNQSPLDVPEAVVLVEKDIPSVQFDNTSELEPIDITAEDASTNEIQENFVNNLTPNENNEESNGFNGNEMEVEIIETTIAIEDTEARQSPTSVELVSAMEEEEEGEDCQVLDATNTTETETVNVACVEEDVSINKEAAKYEDQMMAEPTNIECATEEVLNDEIATCPEIQEQHTADVNMVSSDSPTGEIQLETPITLPQKKIESEEPAIESISAEVEKIAIVEEPKEYIQCESNDNLVEMPPIDSKSSEIKSQNEPEEVKVQIKSKDIELKPPREISSADVDTSKEAIVVIEDPSIRRSGRIRTINKTKQRSQGQGLVKDKKRAPIIIDEDSSNASFDVLTDNTIDKDVSQLTLEPAVRVKTEEELEREKINRENGMKLFISIADNEYRSERTISKEAKKMTCDCFLTHSEIERGEMGCGDDCLNRMLLIECGPKCVVGDRCTNRRFQKHENSPCTIFKTEKKGYGLIATSYIPAGVFIMEYVGEVLNSKQFEKRASDYSKQMNAHYYFMALSSDCVIDATKKGNISRFINHACDPNAETQKWTVNGELRIGFFSKKAIMPDEEITFDYQFQRYGKEAQRCYCESINCRGWIGGEPDSEEEIESEEEEESEDDTATGVENELEKITVAPDETAKKKVKTPKPKKPKDATKKPVKRVRTKASGKISNDFKKHMNRAEIMEDPDLDKEIDVLAMTGLKNQVQTLQFSRLMVRAKLQKAKLRLLQLLRAGELPCRRLFLDYHGLKLMHSWMSDTIVSGQLSSLTFRLEVLQTLENLPITNKTALQDSKVLSTVQRWSSISEYSCLANEAQTPNSSQKISNLTNDESSPSDSGSGTPILNDEISSPKVDETSATMNAAPSADSLNVDQKPAEITTVQPSESNSAAVKSSDVLSAIPQILEQNSTIKGMGVDLLKSIISTTEQNTKIIEDSEKLPDGEMGKLVRDICLLASKLVSSWKQLPESFKIPKKLRIEQMKEHEREADESYKENVEEKTAQKTPSTYTSSGRFNERVGKPTDIPDAREKDPRFRRSFNTISKHQRRQMFEAKVAQEDAERKKTLEHIIHEARCAFFQLDPRITRDFMVPTCVNPATGQWFGDKMIKVPTPPSHSHIKPPPPKLPTEPSEYIIPSIDLPDLWKYAINERGQIYYYHTKILIPQWEPPIKLLPLMEEHRINDIDIKAEHIDTPHHMLLAEDDHEIEHDCDDEDEDVVSILSNSTMNTDSWLELKSDPILEKYNDDDSSSTDSDDSLVNELAELEAKYSYIKKKTDAYWMNMKKPLNLNEEIAAMAKSDSTGVSTQPTENVRARDEEKQSSLDTKVKDDAEKRRKKKCRKQLVQEIRISPLSEEMKRELRRDSRRYKENKAKLRRQKEMLLKRNNDVKILHADAPVRKLKKITEGLPQVSRHTVDSDSHGLIDNHSISVASFLSSRFNNDSFEPKPSAFSALPPSGLSSSSLNTSLNALDTPSRALQSSRNSLPSTSLTQSIVNKLPSIGHKFVGDTDELIMKNTIKPIKPVESVSASVVSPIVKKPTHSIVNVSKSSPKPMMKKKKVSDPKEHIDGNSPAAKKIKEKFKSDISGNIVHYLKPYFSKSCTVGQIQNIDDFKHLAKKLTYFVMLKELKYCNNVSLLEVTDSVKNKAREYIKKYMSKFGKTYIRDENEKDFEDL